MNNKFYKLFLVLISFFVNGICLHSQEVDSREAMSIAKSYFGNVSKVSTPRSLSFGKKETFHIFNREIGGYVIIAGDDRMPAIVGYTDKGSFDAGKLPIQLKKYLEDYSKYVSKIQNNTLRTTSAESKLNPIYAVVSPLAKSRWNQDYPYNIKSPVVNNKKAPTGCIATAMAQIMYYHKWPSKGKDSKTYSFDFNNKQYTLSSNFADHTYEWDKMTDTYARKTDHSNPTESDNEVAELLFDCGVAASMQFTPNSSGASTPDAAEGMEKYFFYKTNYYPRNYYTTNEFIKIIKDNLDNGNPLIYEGHGTSSGHAWIVDGYDSNGFLHCNWGWGGQSDGYFDMNYMNPSSLGIGGGNGGFADSQGVILALPNKDNSRIEKDKVVCQTNNGNITYTLSGNIINITATNISNLTGTPFTASFKSVVRNKDTNEEFSTYNTTLPFSGRGYFFPEIDNSLKFPKALENGTYEITLMYKVDDTQDWLEVYRVNKTEFRIENGKDTNLTKLSNIIAYKKHNIPTTAYYGEKLDVILSLRNDSQFDFNGKIKVNIVSKSNPATTIELFPAKSINIYNNTDKDISFSRDIDKTSIPAGQYKVEVLHENGTKIENFNNEEQVINFAESTVDKNRHILSVIATEFRYGNLSINGNSSIMYVNEPINGSTIKFIVRNAGNVAYQTAHFTIGLRNIKTKVIEKTNSYYSNQTFNANNDKTLLLNFLNGLFSTMKVGERYEPVVICLDNSYQDQLTIKNEDNAKIILEKTDGKKPNLSFNSFGLKKSTSNADYSERVEAKIGSKIKFKLDIKNEGEKDFNSNIQVMIKPVGGYKNTLLGNLNSIQVPASSTSTVLSANEMELTIPEGLEISKEYEFSFYYDSFGEKKLITAESSVQLAKLSIVAEEQPAPITNPEITITINKVEATKANTSEKISINKLHLDDKLKISTTISNTGADYNGNVYFELIESSTSNRIVLGESSLSINNGGSQTIEKTFSIPKNIKLSDDNTTINYQIIVRYETKQKAHSENIVVLKDIPDFSVSFTEVKKKGSTNANSLSSLNYGDNVSVSFNLQNITNSDYTGNIDLILKSTNGSSEAVVLQLKNETVAKKSTQSYTKEFAVPDILNRNQDYKLILKVYPKADTEKLYNYEATNLHIIEEPKAIMGYSFNFVRATRNSKDVELTKLHLGDNVEISMSISNSGNKAFNGSLLFYLYDEKAPDENKAIYFGSKQDIVVNPNSSISVNTPVNINESLNLKENVSYRLLVYKLENNAYDLVASPEIFIKLVPKVTDLNINNSKVDVKRDDKVIDATKANIGDYIDFSFDVNNDGDLDYNNNLKIVLIKNGALSASDIIEVFTIDANIKVGQKKNITYRYQLPSNLSLNAEYFIFMEYQKEGKAVRKILDKTIHIVKKAETNSIETLGNLGLNIRLDKVSRRLMISSDLGVKLVKVYSLDGILIRVLEANSTEMEIDLSNTNSSIFIVSIDNIAPFKISF